MLVFVGIHVHTWVKSLPPWFLHATPKTVMGAISKRFVSLPWHIWIDYLQYSSRWDILRDFINLPRTS